MNQNIKLIQQKVCVYGSWPGLLHVNKCITGFDGFISRGEWTDVSSTQTTEYFIVVGLMRNRPRKYCN